jgi:shikimate dehydrogenase
METYGLIGKSLSHSFSRKYFNEKFRRLDISARYKLFELPEIAAFPALLGSQPALRGLNVTIPYKTQVIPYLHTLSPAAEAIGAVNTIQFLEDRLVGHNTDVIGFEASLRKLLGKNKPARALVLGSGGAARAVIFVLKNMGIRPQLVSRSPAVDQLGYADLLKLDPLAYRLVVNTTPLGMYPEVDGFPPLPYEWFFTPSHFAFDLVYNPPETRFMALARTQGAQVQNGWDMLLGQAEAAWRIWQGPNK